MGRERETLLENVKLQSKKSNSNSPDIYDPFLYRDLEHPTSNTDTLIHLLKGNIGTGILAMAQAFKNSGLYVGLVGTMIMGFVCAHCMHLMVGCSHELCRTQKIPSMDYSDVCYYVFRTGSRSMRRNARLVRVVADFFLCLTQLGSCSVYFLFVAANLQEIVENYYVKIDIRVYLLLLLIPMILINFLKNLKYLAPVSFLASCLFIIGITITFHYMLENLPNTSTVKTVASWKTLPLYFGTAIYAFEGIGVVLPLENNMKTPNDFSGITGILNTGMVIVTTVYTAVGFFGYLKYGENVAASITLNLDSNSILAQFVQLVIALAVFLSYCLIFYVPMKIIGPWFQKHFTNTPSHISDGILRIGLIILTCLVAIGVPQLGAVISLVGALGSSSLALIFPPLLEILTFGADRMGRFYWRFWKNLTISGFGIMSCIFGTYASILILIESNVD